MVKKVMKCSNLYTKWNILTPFLKKDGLEELLFQNVHIFFRENFILFMEIAIMIS